MTTFEDKMQLRAFRVMTARDRLTYLRSERERIDREVAAAEAAVAVAEKRFGLGEQELHELLSQIQGLDLEDQGDVATGELRYPIS